jgi:hypothetical protein
VTISGSRPVETTASEPDGVLARASDDGKQLADRCSNRIGLWCSQGCSPAAPLQDRGVRRIVTEHDRKSAGHRLLRRQREPFADRRQNEQIRGSIQSGDAIGSQRAEKLDVRCIGRSRGAGTGDDQLPLPAADLRGRDGDREPLFLDETADEQRSRAFVPLQVRAQLRALAG